MSRQVLVDLDFLTAQRILNLPAPTLPGHPATKAYADSLKAALDWKESVRAATTANVDLTGPGANIDGVALANGDRVLVKNQTAPVENGVYAFNGAASAMTRVTDADENAEVTAGLSVPVSEGTVNADTIWLLTTNNPITVGTTGLSFTQLGTILSAGDGLTKTGQVVALEVPVTIARGGTGATSAAAARSNLGAPGRHASTIIGDGAATTFNVDHSLNTTDVFGVTVRELATEDEVIADVRVIDSDTVRIGFASAPANGAQFRVSFGG